MEFRFRVPLVGRVAHQERVVECDTSGRENGAVVEVSRPDVDGVQGRDFPVGNFEGEAVEGAGTVARGIAEAAGLEKAGRFFERGEHGSGSELVSFFERDIHERVGEIGCLDAHADLFPMIGDGEGG